MNLISSNKGKCLLFIEDYLQNNNVDNKTKQLIKNLLNSLRNNDYIEYHEIYKQLPVQVKNWCKHPNSMIQGVLPDTLELVIENGTTEEFQELFRENELKTNIYEKITDCAFYGKFEMLKKIIESDIFINKMTLSNSLVFALQQNHYDIVNYLLERNVNNILAYDYLLKNKEYSAQCEYLFNIYGENMKNLYETI
jgi:hypothetical protein